MKSRVILGWLLTTFFTLVLFGMMAILMAGLSVRFSYSGTALPPADCALIFGATVHGREEAGPGITRRVETAARLYGEGKLRHLIFTGGRGDSFKESEAVVMATLAESLGVPSSAIRVEENATSTWENLHHSKSLVDDCSSLIAISDRYHLRRIAMLAGLQGWDVLPTYPADRSAGVQFEKVSLLRETLGVLFYSFVPRAYF